MESSSDETITYDPNQYVLEANPKVVERQGMYLFLIKTALMLTNHVLNGCRKITKCICDGVQTTSRAQY